MIPSRGSLYCIASRRIGLCAVTLALALTVPAAGVGAQDNSIVGPPELSNFQLGPRATQPPPAADAPPVQIAPPPVAAQPQPDTAPPPVTAAPPSSGEAQPAPRPQSRAAPIEQQPAPSADATVVPDLPYETTLPEPPPFVAPQAEPPAAAVPESRGLPAWIWLMSAGLLAMLGFVVLRRRRSAFAASAPEPAYFVEPEPAPAARPAPIPAPAPVAVKPQPRPQLELEFKPERASITDDGAIVHFELTIRNVGESATRRLRIDARVFNAGSDQDREIGAFFSAPVADKNASVLPQIIPARGEVRLPSTVTMALSDIRAIDIQGRRLFVPIIAFNAYYEWGGAESGQTALSYIVGREAAPPAEKMGPFRLDLGPRVYRSLGQRPNKLARRS